MNWKNISIATVAGAVLLASSPVFAAPPRWAPAYGWREHAQYRDAYRHRDFNRHRDHHRVVVIRERPRYAVEHRVVIERRPVIVYRRGPVAYQVPARYVPAPAQPVAYGGSGLATVGGAFTGALIGSRFGEGNGRIASIALGSVVGAYVGNQLANAR